MTFQILHSTSITYNHNHLYMNNTDLMNVIMINNVHY